MDNSCNRFKFGFDHLGVSSLNSQMKLEASVSQVPLVGQHYTRKLKKLGIESIEDLLHHYPFRYDDFTKYKKISELVAFEKATLQVRVSKIVNITTRYRKVLTKASVHDDTGSLEVVWFNQPFITKVVKVGDFVNLSGGLSTFNGRPSFVSPEYEVISNGREPIHTGSLVPIYPETEGISSKWLRSRIKFILDNTETSEISDFLALKIRETYSLIRLETALRHIHFPKDWTQVEEAKKRLAFDELFLIQIKALTKRLEWKNRGKSPELKISNVQFQISNFIDKLPFELTPAQKRCVKEITEDLGKDQPMNRLLEGDVGSGKTVVSAIGMFLTYLNNYQSVLMAPTEVLAEQHYATVREITRPFGLRIGLFTGSKKTPREKEKIDIYIGTHALLFDSIHFKNAGFVIIDEQHRFGVEQRAKLLEKGKTRNLTPHLLTMTATPIPRTVALAFYGDLDLSLLDEMPPGRKKVKTFVVPPEKRKAGEEWIRKQIQENKAQVFVICPLIEESEKIQVKAATDEYERLKREIFTDLRLGLLHGQLGQKNKEEILSKFRDSQMDILVSTSVVEVGIDIPNATIMIIEGADRFGLASLHQLRGRVGRSEKEAYCFLFTDSKSKKAYNRLKFMERIYSGFKLSEIDLKLRGPGEIYGLKQHGLMNLKIATLDDSSLIEKTRRIAQEILLKDRQLERYPELRDKIEKFKWVEPN